MKLLLDTHLLLWWLASAPELSKAARRLIAARENTVFISAASVWELRIKESLGKVKLPEDFESILDEESFEKLSITTRHAHALKALPPIHKDPFDRMLIVQAQLDDLRILTHDEVIARYPVQCELV